MYLQFKTGCTSNLICSESEYPAYTGRFLAIKNEADDYNLPPAVHRKAFGALFLQNKHVSWQVNVVANNYL